jgi:hypothetical protein
MVFPIKNMWDAQRFAEHYRATFTTHHTVAERGNAENPLRFKSFFSISKRTSVERPNAFSLALLPSDENSGHVQFRNITLWSKIDHIECETVRAMCQAIYVFVCLITLGLMPFSDWSIGCLDRDHEMVSDYASNAYSEQYTLSKAEHLRLYGSYCYTV